MSGRSDILRLATICAERRSLITCPFGGLRDDQWVLDDGVEEVALLVERNPIGLDVSLLVRGPEANARLSRSRIPLEVAPDPGGRDVATPPGSSPALAAGPLGLLQNGLRMK